MSDLDIIDAEVIRTGTEWAEVIRADLGRAVEGIVSAGKHLIAAKADVKHGEWLPLLSKVGIDTGTASRLMQIARNPAIGSSGNCQNFPTALRALHELSQLSPEAIESGIEHGDIHPAMTARDAKGYAQEVAARDAPANANADTGGIAEPPHTVNTDTGEVIDKATGEVITHLPDHDAVARETNAIENVAHMTDTLWRLASLRTPEYRARLIANNAAHPDDENPFYVEHFNPQGIRELAALLNTLATEMENAS